MPAGVLTAAWAHPRLHPLRPAQAQPEASPLPPLQASSPPPLEVTQAALPAVSPAPRRPAGGAAPIGGAGGRLG